MFNGIGGVPVYYDHANVISSSSSPSMIHTANTQLAAFFRRYLLQKAISRFEWVMPETWSKKYFLYTLYGWGYLAIINTNKYGVIPQGCTLRGYDVFYRPTHAVIANPLLRGLKDLRIGTQTELIKLMPDCGSIMDLVGFYADMMALTAETAGLNILNSKLSYVFAASEKSAAESFKKLYDKIASGEPAAVVDKNLLNDDGSKAWDYFAQNLKANYIAGDLLSDLRKWEAEFDTKIGIANANTDKKERLISDEVNANNEETRSLSEQWLECLTESVEKARNMFGLSESEFTVKIRETSRNFERPEEVTADDRQE